MEVDAKSLEFADRFMYFVLLFRMERPEWMRLYKHSARCQAALLTFLSCNPHYWCFIPQLYHPTTMDNFNCLGEPMQRESEVDYLVDNGVIECAQLSAYLMRVPLPPARYAFSFQQRQEQRIFFRNMLQGVYGPLPYAPLDLHQFKLIAVRKYLATFRLRFAQLFFSSRTSIAIVSLHYRDIIYCAYGNRVEHDLSTR